MKLHSFYGGVDLYRKEKIFYGHFQKPHRCLSTSRVNGGMHEDLEYMINHQSCEPVKHGGTDLFDVAVNEPERYLKRITSKAGIHSDRATLLNTAANMNNAAIEHCHFEGLEVVAVCTAGVGSNAGRAGDPASYHQTATGIRGLGTPTPKAGTIISMLFINEELTPGALVIAATVATEAKSALLQELCAPSCYSKGIATGTGTDQIGVASMMGSPVCHGDANKHSKLGELIALATRGALLKALNLQSGMTPDSRRSSLLQLQRFGETEDSFENSVAAQLDPQNATLFKNNFLPVNHDPVTVAAVQACVHVKDQIDWGVLPESCANDTLFYQASLIARAVSGKTMDPALFLENGSMNEPANADGSFLSLIHKAFATGFSMKWQGRYED